jgi:hypothetical protein
MLFTRFLNWIQVIIILDLQFKWYLNLNLKCNVNEVINNEINYLKNNRVIKEWLMYLS